MKNKFSIMFRKIDQIQVLENISMALKNKIAEVGENDVLIMLP